MSSQVKVTESAFSRITALQNKANNKNLKLRIKVTGGGCSGFSYDYSMTEESMPDDIVIQQNDAIVLVDKKSTKFLENSTIDFIEELGSQYFAITNPNATTKCGCGNSFSI